MTKRDKAQQSALVMGKKMTESQLQSSCLEAPFRWGNYNNVPSRLVFRIALILNHHFLSYCSFS